MSRRYNINIREWLESHFEVVDAPFPDVRINCPYCSDSRQRLYIAIADCGSSRTGMAWCFNDTVNIDFVGLYAETENISVAEAVDRLFADDPVPLHGNDETFAKKTKTVSSPSKNESPSLAPIVWSPPDYVSLKGLTSVNWNLKLPSYMRNRKVTQEMCETYELGYCLGKSAWSRRMIIPIWQDGVRVGYQGRAMYETDVMKYRFSSPFNASCYLFNWDNIPDFYDSVVLTEGAFDAWAVIRAGFHNVVASFGKHLGASALKKLTTRFQHVTIFWDSDALQETIKLAKKMPHVKRRIAILEAKDPDESTPEAIKEAVLNAKYYPEERELELRS